MAYRILVVLDGSPASEAALPEVERIAVGGAAVHLLQLVQALPPGVNASSAKLRAAHNQALSYLAGLRERFPDVRGLDFIRTGNPAEVILQTALEFDIHLIAMAPHLRATASGRSLGSAAQSVVRRARAAVLLRGPCSLPSAKDLRRILVPLDGSEDSLSILGTVQNLALRIGAEVVFLHVSENSLLPLPLPFAPRAMRVLEDPRAKLLRLADHLERSRLSYWQAIAEGEPVAEILRHAETLDADLIAMTARVDLKNNKTATMSSAVAILDGAKRAVLFQNPATPPPLPNAWTFQ